MRKKLFLSLKRRLVSLKGLLLIISVGGLVLIPGLAVAQDSINPCAAGGLDLAMCTTSGLQIGSVIGTLVQFLFVIAVILSLGYLVFAGIKWITSGGDKDRVAGARSMIIAAIVGLIVVFLSYVVLNLVLTFLTGSGLSGIQIPSFSPLFTNSNTTSTTTDQEVWNEPAMATSQSGLVEVTLHAKKSLVTIGNEKTSSDVYNEQYIGGTIEVKGGDTLKVHLINDLDKPTNLHFHGGHVSPKGNSDNVLLQINPGETFDYEFKLPANHPPGLYWYHPHHHPDVDNQVSGGMVGAIIVRGDVDELPGVKGVPERMMVLTTVDGNDNNVPTRLVNGIENPTMYLRPGETVRLQVLNASADDFFNLAIPGYKLNIISRDGNTLSQVDSVDSEVLAPGQRVQILFTPTALGEIPVKSLYFDQGFSKYVEAAFMNIQVQGEAMTPSKLPTTLLPHEDLRNVKIDRVRTLTFSEGGTPENTTFLLDGKMVDMNVVSQIMTLGTTEEWRIVNTSTEMHPFHIHINPFQVISVNGQPVDLYGYRDTVAIPANGELVMRTRYKDFDGKFVLHCHILFHEDHGMMQVVEVVKPGAGPASDNGLPEREYVHPSQMGMMPH